jgi:hypothetical protein
MPAGDNHTLDLKLDAPNARAPARRRHADHDSPGICWAAKIPHPGKQYGGWIR